MLPMTLEEALAVYLTLQNQEPGKRDDRLFAEAWGVIWQEGERIARERRR